MALRPPISTYGFREFLFYPTHLSDPKYIAHYMKIIRIAIMNPQTYSGIVHFPQYCVVHSLRVQYTI